MGDFIFASKENYIFGIIVLGTIFLYILNHFFWKKSAGKFLSPPMLERMLGGRSRIKKGIKKLFIIFAMVFILIALMRPQYGLKNVEIHQTGIDLAIILDVSKSMMARDVTPDRLTGAKMEIIKLLDLLKGGRITLIPFAGIPFIQNPLTSDKEVIKVYLQNLSFQDMPIQGTALGMAMKMTINALDLKAEEGDVKNYKGAKHKGVIIFTDGENHEGDPLKVAEELKEYEIKIWTVGVGTPNGEPIPVIDENGKIIGTMKEDDGKTPVFSKLNEKLLKEIAEKTGGKYFHYGGKSVAENIYKEIESIEKKEYEEKIKKFREDRFQIALLPALIFLIIEIFLSERKRFWRKR